MILESDGNCILCSGLHRNRICKDLHSVVKLDIDHGRMLVTPIDFIFYMQGVTNCYTLFASIPIINPPQGTDWKIDLIDNPGFGDAKKGVSDLATAAVTSSSSYVYIMNYTQLGDHEDTKAFRLMAAKDKGNFGVS